MMQVTPGFGTSVATELKGNAHHQRVIAHQDAVRSQVIPAVSAAQYTDGQCVGGELTFAGVVRLAGDTAEVLAVEVALRGLSTPADLDIVLYPDNLNTAPVNGQDFALLADEVQSILGIVRVPASAFGSLGGHHFAAVVPATPLLIEAASGVSSVRGTVVARGPIEPAASDSLVVSIVTRRS
jgi:hypothetical protein